MKRRRAQRSRSRRAKSSNKSSKSSRTFSKSNATDFDEISRKELQDDKMGAIMDDLNGYHHCRICNQTFNTKSTQHFIPQWLSHKSSKKHGNNKQILFEKLKNGKVTVMRSSSSPDISSSSYQEEEEEEESETEETDYEHHQENEEEEEEDEDEESENEDDADDDIKPIKSNFRRTRNNNKKNSNHIKQKKHLKIRLPLNHKSKNNNRYKIKCPYCNKPNIVQIQISSSKKFQLSSTNCVAVSCKQQFWIQIKENKPIITKHYPFTTTNNNNVRKRKQRETDNNAQDHSSDVEVISPPRKKRRRNHLLNTENEGIVNNENNVTNDDNAYYESVTNCIYPIPFDHDIDHDNDNSDNGAIDKKIKYNDYVRPYSSKMSHIEMVESCSRSLCSDFIPGDDHCWQGVPVSLPGGIRMAQIGYIFECCWCGKEVCYVEKAQIKEQKKYDPELEIVTASIVDNNNNNNSNNKNKSLCHQSRQIHSFLLNKWKNQEGLPFFSADGPSYSRVPSSLNNLRIKDRVMASDGNNWLPAWVEDLNKNRVLIHFKGWNSRWDKWFNVNSGMLRTINDFRKEKKLMSATRNEDVYQIMNDKYPLFIPSNLYETELNKNKNKNKNKTKRDKEEIDSNSVNSGDENEKNKIFNAEIVMMHDKNEEFMTIHELPIHNASEMILCPPLFFSASSLNMNICKLIRKCFIHLSGVLNHDEDIKLIYKHCESKMDVIFFTLHTLKRPQRVEAYLKLLKYDNNIT